VRHLQAWGLGTALEQVAFQPQHLVVCNAHARKGQDGVLGRLRLGQRMQDRYGAPYFTLARADLHQLLLSAVKALPVELQLARRVVSLKAEPQVEVKWEDLKPVSGSEALHTQIFDAVVGADGLWSHVRQALQQDGPAHAIGHCAYRAQLPMQALPAQLRSFDVTVWLGQRFHVVHYPVKGGELLNVVVIVEGPPCDKAQWLSQITSVPSTGFKLATQLLDVLNAADDWQSWPLFDRPALNGPQAMAQGHVALLGDAAHPMRPYLAQGAAMAIEDAKALAQAWGPHASSATQIPAVLQTYALNRWRRNAQVQRRAQRNGFVFHLQGPMAWARDRSIQWLGESVLDIPWLYSA
jgi:salicylate hydroxylase